MIDTKIAINLWEYDPAEEQWIEENLTQIEVGKYFVIRATLTDLSDNPIANKSLELYVDQVFKMGSATDSYGVVVFPYYHAGDAPFALGNRRISVLLPTGDPQYNYSKTTVYLNVIEAVQCSCSAWTNGACINSTQREQTRSCTPSGCDTESRVVVDSSCAILCDCTEWVNGQCSGDGFRSQTRVCNPSGCEAESREIADSSCNVNPPTPKSNILLPLGIALLGGGALAYFLSKKKKR